MFVRKDNKVYIILIALTTATFFLQYLIGRSFEYESDKSILSACFILINIFLIIKPWSFASISIIENNHDKFLSFFKNILYKVLIINLVLNSSILLVVLIYLPNIAAFKAESAYLKLYDQIPYFANVFRYAFTTQSAGYLAIPIFYYHLSRSQKREAYLALFYSSSTLLSSFAFYSRAQMITYVLIFVLYFFLIKKTLPLFIQRKLSRVLFKSSLLVAIIFLSVTYIRFSALDYRFNYGDRIPQNSIIKDPVVYSLFDYASQSHSNGLHQLDQFTADKVLNGEQFFRDIYQILNFFGVMNWDVKEYQDRKYEAYNDGADKFLGYTTPLVFNFGYIITFLVSILYYLIVKNLLKRGYTKSIISTLYIVLLLFIPTVSIFYTGYSLILFPLILILSCRILFILTSLIKQFLGLSLN
ncbi:oligosaccharide repeat unit polymerase [Cyclobacteriaceae bacterium]|nr:oligosaccharide repeat unit polymerase [Cyclobacteriaceae bacterium]